MNIYKKSVLAVVGIFVIIANAVFGQEKLNVLNINTPGDIQAFFEYSPNCVPIISGHRGGMEKGFPENSIATFENTLKHTPAFFEIDPRMTKDGVIVLLHDERLEEQPPEKAS